MKARAPFLISLRVSITAVMVTTVLTLAVATVILVVAVGGDAARKNAQVLFLRTAEAVAQKTESLVQKPVDLARYAALDGDSGRPVWGDGLEHPFLKFMEGALEASPVLSSIYVGGSDGSFFQVIQTNRDQRLLAAHHAPGGTRFIVRTIVPGRSFQRWTFVGADGVLGRRVDPVDFHAADRPWFRFAKAGQGVVLSEPYNLAPLGEPGITASIARPDGKVVGVDLPLVSLQSFLGDQSVSAHGGLMVQNKYGAVLARSVSSERRPDDISYAVDKTLAGLGLRLLFWAPLDDFGAEFRTMEWSVALTTLVLLLVLVPLVLAFTRRLTRIMTELSADVDLVCRMDFSGVAPHGSAITEFDRLARGFGTMKSTLSNETAKLAEAQLKLKKIVETGIALSTEKDSNTLCQKILDTAKDLTDADGGTLYLLNENETFLDFNIMLNDTLGTRFGGTSGRPIPPGLRVQLYKDDGGENHNNVASHAFLTGETVNIRDAYDDDRFDFSGTKTFDVANGYRSQSFLTIPLKPMGGEVLGCLQLINAKGPDKTIVPFTKDMQDFVEALAASAATAIYNRHLLDDLEQLFDAIIDVINGALGRKSPYTGGHCERVPIIAKMLAEATSAVTEGPLAGFSLDDRGLREFELAAKLHDVGKVTTPEYVVDKSTKLETIYNRVHEIRTRFEVLYRDAVIRRHETVLADPSQAARADAELAAYKATLVDEWAFLAQSNQGGEFLSPDKIAKIRAIGARTWVRHFDDRLGLSWEEEARLEGVPPTPLPAPTTLLADEARHIFARLVPFDEAYKTVGGQPYPFQTPVPELLYNQGEVYNLSVSRGTLTNEEHFKIKEHVMQSIYMLDRLPWPKQLRNVPVIAGQHHETLVGTGYPCRATSDELSMQSRILTLADIFEALTASDRPYKKAKSLSEAVKILYNFKKDRHIDADLFDLFLTTGVYRRYAEGYLSPEQLDEVDIGPYLGPV